MKAASACCALVGAVAIIVTSVCAVENSPVNRRKATSQDGQPKMVSSGGSLYFIMDEGKRAGYKIGDEEPVHFDCMTTTEQTMGQLVQHAYQTGKSEGKAEGKAEAEIDNLKYNLTVHALMATYTTEQEVQDTLAAELAGLKVLLEDDADDKVQKASESMKRWVEDEDDDVKKIIDSKTAIIDAKVKSSLESYDERIRYLERTAQAAQSVGGQLYWMDMNVLDGEAIGKTYVTPFKSGTILKIIGIGFDEFYHPKLQHTFQCHFYSKGIKNETTYATVVSSQKDGATYYHLECEAPKYEELIRVQVIVTSHGGSVVPFRGIKGGNFFDVETTFTKVTRKQNFPDAPTYEIEGNFVVNTQYRCTYTGDLRSFTRAVTARDAKILNCGKGPEFSISSDASDSKEGTAILSLQQITSKGLLEMKAASVDITKIKYTICSSKSGGSVFDCITGCPLSNGAAGQAQFTSPGLYSWKAPFCGDISVVAIGGGGGGGWQWSSGGGGGGGLGWIRKFQVVKGQSYKVVVGRGGHCQNNARNGGTQADNSYFKDLNTVAGYGGGRGGPHSRSASPGYGGGYFGDGGGRGGDGAYDGSWTRAGAGAGGYMGRGGGDGSCSNGCGAPPGGGGGSGGYYSSTYGVPAGGGVGIMGQGASGGPVGNQYYGGRGGSGGSHGRGGENSGQSSRCGITGGNYGGGGGGSGTSYGGGRGAGGAVRIIWGVGRQYPRGGGNV